MAMKNFGIIIDEKVQKEFKDVVKAEHNRVKGIYGYEVANAMKLYTAINGREKYMDDPDVLELVSKVGGSFTARAYNISKKGNISENIVLDLVEEIKNLKAEVSYLRAEVKGRPSKKTGSISEFKKQFQATYGGFKQVSRRDITHFVTDNYDVHDSRAIQNRINFLIAHDVLEPYTNNVFNVKI